MDLPKELLLLIIAIIIGSVIGLCVGILTLLINKFKTGKFFQKTEPVKLESPFVFYLGILLFGIASILGYLIDYPYFGSTFLFVSTLYLWGLITYIKDRRKSKHNIGIH